jgi:hypothetical protein
VLGAYGARAAVARGIVHVLVDRGPEASRLGRNPGAITDEAFDLGAVEKEPSSRAATAEV